MIEYVDVDRQPSAMEDDSGYGIARIYRLRKKSRVFFDKEVLDGLCGGVPFGWLNNDVDILCETCVEPVFPSKNPNTSTALHGKLDPETPQSGRDKYQRVGELARGNAFVDPQKEQVVLGLRAFVSGKSRHERAGK